MSTSFNFITCHLIVLLFKNRNALAFFIFLKIIWFFLFKIIALLINNLIFSQRVSTFFSYTNIFLFQLLIVNIWIKYFFFFHIFTSSSFKWIFVMRRGGLRAWRNIFFFCIFILLLSFFSFLFFEFLFLERNIFS